MQKTIRKHIIPDFSLEKSALSDSEGLQDQTRREFGRFCPEKFAEFHQDQSWAIFQIDQGRVSQILQLHKIVRSKNPGLPHKIGKSSSDLPNDPFAPRNCCAIPGTKSREFFEFHGGANFAIAKFGIIAVVFSIFLCSAPGIVNWAWAEDLSPKDPYSWVRYFNDPLLESAVQEALNNNYDLQKALARIEAAKAAVARAQAGLKPTLNLRARALELVGLQGPGYSAFAKGFSVDLDWDIDIWGEGRLELDAQKARRNALFADLAFARQSIVVETVKAWFLAIEIGRQMGLAERSVETYRKIVTIVEVKYKEGAVPKQDVNLAKADLARAEEAYLQVQGANKEVMQTLKLLLGRDPGGKIILSENLPDILPYSSGSDSPQLAVERQDVLAARYRHDATSLNLEQTKKKNYPNIQIGSSANKLSEELNILTDSSNAFATFGASAEMPLMDGGRNKADILAAKAEEKETQVDYQKKSLEVRHEVQTALANDELLQKRKEFLEAALAESTQDLGLAQKQYEAGKIDAIKVIYSMLRVEEAEIKLLHLKTAQLMQRADLYVILGGVLHDK